MDNRWTFVEHIPCPIVLLRWFSLFILQTRSCSMNVIIKYYLLSTLIIYLEKWQLTFALCASHNLHLCVICALYAQLQWKPICGMEYYSAILVWRMHIDGYMQCSNFFLKLLSIFRYFILFSSLKRIQWKQFDKRTLQEGLISIFAYRYLYHFHIIRSKYPYHISPHYNYYLIAKKST